MQEDVPPSALALGRCACPFHLGLLARYRLPPSCTFVALVCCRLEEVRSTWGFWFSFLHHRCRGWDACSPHSSALVQVLAPDPDPSFPPTQTPADSSSGSSRWFLPPTLGTCIGFPALTFAGIGGMNQRTDGSTLHPIPQVRFIFKKGVHFSLPTPAA